jgi:hypothetical protein
VPLFAGFAQRLLRLDDQAAESAAQENDRLLSRIHHLHAEANGVIGSPHI